MSGVDSQVHVRLVGTPDKVGALCLAISFRIKEHRHVRSDGR